MNNIKIGFKCLITLISFNETLHKIFFKLKVNDKFPKKLLKQYIKKYIYISLEVFININIDIIEKVFIIIFLIKIDLNFSLP